MCHYIEAPSTWVVRQTQLSLVTVQYQPLRLSRAHSSNLTRPDSDGMYKTDKDLRKICEVRREKAHPL